jgi:hypothetical protein
MLLLTELKVRWRQSQLLATNPLKLSTIRAQGTCRFELTQLGEGRGMRQVIVFRFDLLSAAETAFRRGESGSFRAELKRW